MPSCAAPSDGTPGPPIKANYKDKFGAAVGYLTAEASSVKLGKGQSSATKRAVRQIPCSAL